MPKKVTAKTGKHGQRQGAGQDPCKEGPRRAYDSQVQEQYDLHSQHLVKTSDVYPDTPFVSVTGDHIERCRDAVGDVYNKGIMVAKAEYRRLYRALIETDRTGFKARSDSGDHDAMKQWGKFCDDTVKLLFLRGMIFNKGPELQQIGEEVRCTFPGDLSQPDQSFQVTDSLIKDMGRVMYAVCKGVGGQGEIGSKVVSSDMLPDDFDVILDMSQWVRRGALHPISNRTMKIFMAVTRKIHGDDMCLARHRYHILHVEIQDVDQDQLANQAEAGITKESTENYGVFYRKCCQLAALWQILHNKPIPVRSRFDGITKLMCVPVSDREPPAPRTAAVNVSYVNYTELNHPLPALTDKEVLDMGKVTYAAYRDEEARNKGQAAIVMHSDTLPGDFPVLLDMSQWVMKGALLCVNNSVMIHRIAQMRAFFGTDELKARSAYQIIMVKIKDVDQEQMINQAQGCKSEGAMASYKTFCEQCFQLAALWQIIYNKPIPIKSSFEGVECFAFRISCK